MIRKTAEKSRGQSLVEVALALPVIVMLMLGLLDFGRAYYALVTLRDAAEEGAMYAAMDSDLSQVAVRVRGSEATDLVPMDEVVVTMSSGPYTFGEPITVTLTYSMTMYTPFASNFTENGVLVLRGQAVQPVMHSQ